MIHGIHGRPSSASRRDGHHVEACSGRHSGTVIWCSEPYAQGSEVMGKPIRGWSCVRPEARRREDLQRLSRVSIHGLGCDVTPLRVSTVLKAAEHSIPGLARGPCPFGSGYLSQAVPSLSPSSSGR